MGFSTLKKQKTKKERKKLAVSAVVIVSSCLPAIMAFATGTETASSCRLDFCTAHNQGSMPALGLGTATLKGRTCEKAVQTALAAGYRHLDTALL